MSKARILLPMLEEFRNRIHYDAETGCLHWKFLSGVGDFEIDKPDSKKEYKIFYMNYIQYSSHRVIWLLVTGEEPPEQIDHKDLDGLNNIWENLRESNNSTNNMNRKGWAKSGYKGVYKYRNSFVANIRKDGVRYYLGSFSTAEIASEAYCKAAKELHKEYSRLEHKTNNEN